MAYMAPGPHSPRLPLVPLADVVHFPRTELRLHVADPASRRLVRAVIEKDEDARWIGVVLLKPGSPLDGSGHPEIFPGGTAGRLLDADLLPDGCANIVLHGEFRFRLQREVAVEPYRQALVEPVEEPWLNERDAGILVVRSGILELLRWLQAELGSSFFFGESEMEDLSGPCIFEELVNRVAASLDVPPLRKQLLLQEAVPDRALSVLSILRSRQQVIDRLRPFRHLAANSSLN
jgi:Lon protease-like protein